MCDIFCCCFVFFLQHETAAKVYTYFPVSLSPECVLHLSPISLSVLLWLLAAGTVRIHHHSVSAAEHVNNMDPVNLNLLALWWFFPSPFYSHCMIQHISPCTISASPRCPSCSTVWSSSTSIWTSWNGILRFTGEPLNFVGCKNQKVQKLLGENEAHSVLLHIFQFMSEKLPNFMFFSSCLKKVWPKKNLNCSKWFVMPKLILLK